MPYSSDLATGGTATASSQFGQHSPAMAFNDSIGLAWASDPADTAPWIKYQLTSAHAISKIRLYPYDTSGLKNFRFYGSNDDVNWTLLFTGVTAQSGWSEFIFSNSVNYLYYKLEVVDQWGGTTDVLVEMEMMEIIPMKKGIVAAYNVRKYASRKAAVKYGVGYKSPLSRNFMARYHFKQPALKEVSAVYAVLQSATVSKQALYHVFQAIGKAVRSLYHARPPVVKFYDSADSIPLGSLELGLLLPGQVSQEIEIHLWNDRDGSADSLGMADVVITVALSTGGYAGGLPEQGQEVIDGKWVEIKSSGVTGQEITDDAQTVFSPVGGNLATGGLALGSIPRAAARHLRMRVNVPASVSGGPFALYPVIALAYSAAFVRGFGYNFGNNFGGLT